MIGLCEPDTRAACIIVSSLSGFARLPIILDRVIFGPFIDEIIACYALVIVELWNRLI